MSEQNVVEIPSRNASADRGNQDFGSEDFGNRDFGNRDFGTQPGNQDFGDGDSGGSGESIAHGQGQSKSSRRRRRKRKGKVGGDGPVAEGEAPVPVPIVMEGESLALAASAAPAQPQQRRQNTQGGGQQAQQNQQGQGQGTGKRWKKKFRDRERRPARNENPGNDFRSDANSPAGQNGFAQGNGGGGFSQNYGGQNYGNGGGFKRKGKQGGARKERGSFVGPMDHSYREVNGNFADPSASTIPLNGFGGRKGGHRHHGDSQPIDHSMPRAIPIPEGAQTHIYFFIEDLFFTAKIQETARKQGVKVQFMKNEKDAVAELTSGSEENKPALIVFDLNNANAKPLTLIPKLKTKLKKSVSIIGFLSHLQGDLKAKAVEAGCDAVMPRAAFSQNLPNLLRRYSVEEGEEVNYNQ